MKAARTLSLCAVIGGLFALATNACAGGAAYLSCALSKDGPTARLYRSAKVSDSHRYAIQLNKGDKQPVFDSTDDGDRGSNVKATCAGTAQARALVVQGEFFGSAYPKGFVVLWNPFVKEVERIDFAERSFPAHIYLSQRGATVVMPNLGNETASRYIAYTYSATGRQTATGPLDELPVIGSNQLDVIVRER